MHSQPRKSPDRSVTRRKAGCGPWLWSHEPGLRYNHTQDFIYPGTSAFSLDFLLTAKTTRLQPPAWAWQTFGTSWEQQQQLCPGSRPHEKPEQGIAVHCKEWGTARGL